MSNKKYILSICWMDSHKELFSSPYGLFNTYDEAIEFADEKIDEIKDEYIEEYDEDYVDEYVFFNFTIKEINIT